MVEDHTEKANLYRSAISLKPLTMKSARVIVVGDDEITRQPAFEGIVEAADLNVDEVYRAIEEINLLYWDSVEQEIFGRFYNVFDYENYIARVPGSENIAGHICITEEKEGFIHIVVLHVYPEWHGRGVGQMLVNIAVDKARKIGLNTVKLATTNDNIPALYFYQRLGFVIENIDTEVVADDANVPPNGFAGIPVRDEIHLRLDLE